MLETVKNSLRFTVAAQVVEAECGLSYGKLMYATGNAEAFAEFAKAMEAGTVDAMPKGCSEALRALHETCREFYGKFSTRLRLGFDREAGPVWWLPNAETVVQAPEVKALRDKYPNLVERLARTRNVVRRANGRFVKDWQYSQGHFDVIETDDPLEACDVNSHSFKTFFAKDGATALTLTLAYGLQ